MLGARQGVWAGADQRAVAGAREGHGRELADVVQPLSGMETSFPGFIAARCVLACSLTPTCPHLGFELARLAEFLR